MTTRDLLGRHSECAALDQFVASVRAGPSRALVLRGEAGVGKSALLEYLVQRASGCHVVRAAGVESEMELAFAGLQLLCAPFMDRLERLPADLFCGRIGAAVALAAEADAVVEATGSDVALRGAIALANWRGQDTEARALVEAGRRGVMQHGEGLWLVATDWGNAVRYNGLGRYDDALVAAERAAGDPCGLGTPMWLLADLVEAAARSGKPERAVGPLERLTEIAEANGSDWALGFLARSRALLGEGQAAERLYREAIDRLGRTLIRVAHARTLLVYGEWLRRENRRVDAREQLRAAHATLSDIGMEVFAERARRELLATGETVRKRTVETLDNLTPQELQIAQRAAEGRTNPEIGAQLFLSPRTVEWHLRKVFGKLGISSRRQLGSALPDASPAAVLL